MRNLEIATKNRNICLENIPDNYKFIESIAKQYANSKEKLEIYFQTGLIAYKELEATESEEYVEKVALWTVRQSIIEKATKQ